MARIVKATPIVCSTNLQSHRGHNGAIGPTQEVSNGCISPVSDSSRGLDFDRRERTAN